MAKTKENIITKLAYVYYAQTFVVPERGKPLYFMSLSLDGLINEVYSYVKGHWGKTVQGVLGDIPEDKETAIESFYGAFRPNSREKTGITPAHLVWINCLNGGPAFPVNLTVDETSNTATVMIADVMLGCEGIYGLNTVFGGNEKELHENMYMLLAEHWGGFADYLCLPDKIPNSVDKTVKRFLLEVSGNSIHSSISQEEFYYSFETYPDAYRVDFIERTFDVPSTDLTNREAELELIRSVIGDSSKHYEDYLYP